jgi:hypothetical protein
MRKCLWLLLFFLPGLSAAQVFTSSNLPILVINTKGQTIVDEPKINCDMRLVYNGPGVRNLVSGPFLGYDGRVGIELRGSSSQDVYDKKGYGIELRDADGEDREEALLGMPKESDWVLVGPYNDKSLMRDALAQRLAGEIMGYSPRMHCIELVINGNYRGVYLLGEKIKRDKDRVNIAKAETDVTGGYILKCDKYTGATNDGWTSAYPPTGATFQTTDFLYHYPAADEISSAQKNYIRQWMQQFESALAGPQFRDSLLGYRRFIDQTSFIDYMLINEAVRNVDAYRLSAFMYKNRDSIDSRLHMGPVWDFNIAFGLGDYCNAQNTSGWAWNMHLVCGQDTWLVPFWWARFRQDPDFMRASADRWKSLRTGPLSHAHTNLLIDSLSNLLQESQARNFQRWPVMGQYIWPNAFVGNTYSSEVQYLRNWFRDRMIWMDGAFDAISDTIGYEPNRLGEVHLYPNPVAVNVEFLTDVYAQGADRVRIRVLDMLGRVVQDMYQVQPSTGLHTFRWPSLPVGGAYQVQVYLDNQLQMVGKLIIR